MKQGPGKNIAAIRAWRTSGFHLVYLIKRNVGWSDMGVKSWFAHPINNKGRFSSQINGITVQQLVAK